MTDKPHDQGFIEEYVNVSQGSGQAFLDAMTAFATRARHPELATAPFLLWGMSAGGEFNYEFVGWKPERVVAFVVNKGNIYYTALAPAAARSVPGILFTGGKDLEFRTNTITGLFAVNRRGGALWALAEEPSAGHIVGRSRDVALVLFEDALALRVGDGSGVEADRREVRFPRRPQGEDVSGPGRGQGAELSDGVAADGARGRAVAVARDGEAMKRAGVVLLWCGLAALTTSLAGQAPKTHRLEATPATVAVRLLLVRGEAGAADRVG